MLKKAIVYVAILGLGIGAAAMSSGAAQGTQPVPQKICCAVSSDHS